MKKILALTLSIIIAGTAFSGCGNTDSENEINNTTNASESSEAATEPVTEEKTKTTTEHSTKKEDTPDENRFLKNFENKYNSFLKNYLKTLEKDDLYERYKLTKISTEVYTSVYTSGQKLNGNKFEEYVIALTFDDKDISSVAVADNTGKNPNVLLFMAYAAITDCSRTKFDNFINEIDSVNTLRMDNVINGSPDFVHELYDGKWTWSYRYTEKDKTYRLFAFPSNYNNLPVWC